VADIISLANPKRRGKTVYGIIYFIGFWTNLILPPWIRKILFEKTNALSRFVFLNLGFVIFGNQDFRIFQGRLLIQSV